MKFFRQVANDLLKEIVWIVFFCFMMSIVVIAFGYLVNDYPIAVEKNHMAELFIKHDVYFLRLMQIPDSKKDIQAEPLMPADMQTEVSPAASSGAESLLDYLTATLTPESKGGTFFSLGPEKGYDHVYLLLGKYSELTTYQPTGSEDVEFAVSSDLAETKADTIQHRGKSYPLHVVPNGFGLYNPYMAYESELRSNLKNTLYVFIRDYALVDALFPVQEYWGQTVNAVLNWYVLTEPTVQDLTRLRRVIADSGLGYASLQSAESWIRNSTEPGLKTHRTNLWFYVTAILALCSVLFSSMWRIFQRKAETYSIHRLFGATDFLIFIRMLCFAIVYLGLPFGIGIYAVSKQSVTVFPDGSVASAWRSALQSNEAIIIAIVLAIIIIVSVTWFAHRTITLRLIERRKE